MKRKAKVLMSALFAVTTMALTVFASGCSLKDTIKQIGCQHNYGAMATEILEEPTCMEKGLALRTCVKCGKEKKEKIEKVAHVFDGGTVTKEANCTTEGERVYKCTNEGCKESKKETIAKTEHTRVDVPMVPSTCTKAGTTAYSYCSDCNTFLVPKSEIPALGHSVVTDAEIAATCTTDGKTEGKHCSKCNVILTEQKKIPATGHTVVIDPAVEATCEDGLTAGSHCSKCDEVMVAQEVIPGNGQHGTPVAVEEKAPTCQEPGHTAGTACALCGTVLSGCEEIPIAHEAEYVDGYEPTCAIDGCEGGYVCSLCHIELSGFESIPALSDDYGCKLDENGICEVCGFEDIYINYALSDDGTVAIASDLKERLQGICVAAYYQGVPVKIVDKFLYGVGGVYAVYLPKTVEIIVADAFYGCKDLESLYIYGDVIVIGQDAFVGCSENLTLYIDSEVPPTVIDSNTLTNVHRVILLNGGRDAYIAHEDWAAYADRIVNA